MKKLVFAALIALLLGIFLFFNQTQSKPHILQQSPSPISTIEEERVETKASFTIITGSITRSFTNPKYHQKSADVFITAEDPSIIHVTKIGTTWQDFFDTLPMKLTKDCLTSGDGERLCNTDGSLKFYLNDIEDKDLLEREIKDGDKALIKFIAF